jgi:hypothetical protein
MYAGFSRFGPALAGVVGRTACSNCGDGGASWWRRCAAWRRACGTGPGESKKRLAAGVELRVSGVAEERRGPDGARRRTGGVGGEQAASGGASLGRSGGRAGWQLGRHRWRRVHTRARRRRGWLAIRAG